MQARTQDWMKGGVVIDSPKGGERRWKRGRGRGGGGFGGGGGLEGGVPPLHNVRKKRNLEISF